ncbi:MAG TPA: NUDIX hydrolase [Dehalococcoidales bacterium]|nr:NUDIX hydrolase [Dehalococcoidales bacterium]
MSEKILSHKVIFKGQILTLRVDTVKTADNRRSTREIIEHAPCVAIVAIDGEDNVLLVRQFRLAAGRELLEIPAGGIEKGESPEEAVVREMREETGLRPRKVERLTGFYLSPGFSSEYLHLFLASEFERGPLSAEDTAEIALVKTPISQIKELISSGKIEDGKSVAGLLMYLEFRK